MTTHWSQPYLRYGYERGADGPERYDCWSFFRLVQRERFGRDVPFMPTPQTLLRIARVMDVWAAELGWRPVAEPETGDAAFLSFWRHPTHVGVFVGDLREPAVLHCQEGGAALHSLFHLQAAGWRVRSWYRRQEA